MIVKVLFGTLYDIKPYLRGFWAATFLSCSPLLAGSLAWSEPVNGLQIAVEAQPEATQAKLHFRNASEEPLTLLHPNTHEENAALFHATGAVLAVEAVATTATPSPLEAPYLALRRELTGFRQAFILQPGEERSFERPVPRVTVPLPAKWPGEVEMMERAIAPGSQITYRYANHHPEFLGDQLWHGEVVSPPVTWGKQSSAEKVSPLNVRLEPVTVPGHWHQPLQVKLTVTNDGSLPVYARLVPTDGVSESTLSAGLWSLLSQDGLREIPSRRQASLPAFPQPEHHVVLEPGKSRTWTLSPERWLQLERPGAHRLRLNAQLHWQAARDWEVASALSLLRLEQLEVQPIDEVADVYLPQITADAR